MVETPTELAMVTILEAAIQAAVVVEVLEVVGGADTLSSVTSYSVSNHQLNATSTKTHTLHRAVAVVLKSVVV